MEPKSSHIQEPVCRALGGGAKPGRQLRGGSAGGAAAPGSAPQAPGGGAEPSPPLGAADSTPWLTPSPGTTSAECMPIYTVQSIPGGFVNLADSVMILRVGVAREERAREDGGRRGEKV